jgi:hypothetical protein
MMRILMVLGCFGLVVGSAQAGQWSAETCGHLEEMRIEVLAMDMSPYYRAMWSLPILTNQHTKCGVVNQKEFEAALAVVKVGERPTGAPSKK